MAMDDLGIPLSVEQEAEAARIEGELRASMDRDIRLLARRLASKEDSQLFGQTEFEVRDDVHRIGAKALEIAANGRSKKGVLR